MQIKDANGEVIVRMFSQGTFIGFFSKIVLQLFLVLLTCDLSVCFYCFLSVYS